LTEISRREESLDGIEDGSGLGIGKGEAVHAAEDYVLSFLDEEDFNSGNDSNTYQGTRADL
jgi:hypothetical protein